MNKMKRVSIISLLLVFTIVLSACSTDGKLLSALKKQQQITSFEEEINFKVKLTSEGLTEDLAGIFDSIAGVVNSSEVKVNQKTILDNDKEEMLGSLDISGKFAGKESGLGIWIQMDNKEEKSNLIEIVKLPKELLSMMGEDLKDIDYLVYDFNELMEYQNQLLGGKEGPNVSLDGVTKWAFENQENFEKIMGNIAEKVKIDGINHKGKEVINGEKLDVYEISLDDKSFKKLLLDGENALVDDEDFNKLMKEYLEVIGETVKDSEGSEDLAKEIAMYDENMAKLKKDFNEFMKKLEDINVLGKDGIKIELGINKDGYIVSEKGKVDMELNLEELVKPKTLELESEPGVKEKIDIPGQKGKINMVIDYDSKMSNINKKDLKVEMPKLTKENSKSFVKIIKEMEERYK